MSKRFLSCMISVFLLVMMVIPTNFQSVKSALAVAPTDLFSTCWLAYSPTNYNPEVTPAQLPDEQSIINDLTVLKNAGVTGLITYGSFYDALGVFVPRQAQNLGLRLIIGIWDPLSQDEITKAVAVKDNPFVVGYVVGNEGLNVRYTLSQLDTAITQVRQSTNKPVTTSEEWADYFAIGSTLLTIGDWVFPNVHPYWGGVREPVAAVDWTKARYDQFLAATALPVVFKEVGLPSAGHAAPGETSELRQAQYYARLRLTNVAYTTFEAFDKTFPASPPEEQHWGVLRSNRSAKPAAATLCKMPVQTIGIYRPSVNLFMLRYSNSTGPADLYVNLSSLGMNPSSEFRDVPIVGDWNGDGVDTVGFYRRGRVSDGAGAGLFVLSNSNTSPQANHMFILGNPDDTPLAGDWDGDGRDSVGVFRPSNGLIYLKNQFTTGFADFTMVLGNPGDSGIAGDWNDGGVNTPGVYRPSATDPLFYLTNAICNCIAFADYVGVLGNPADQPFTGDWDGDGRTGLGVFRPSNGLTYLRNDPTGNGFADLNFVYGNPNDFAFGGAWLDSSGIASFAQPEIAPTFVPAP